jgi:hypothetical protein
MCYFNSVRYASPIKALFTVIIAVALLWASTMAVSHVDGMSGESSVAVAMDNACCPDQNDAGQDGKGIPHNCCMAHCLSMKTANPVLALVRVQPYATVIHIIADGDVAPNQFLKSLFRPPRTLA